MRHAFVRRSLTIGVLAAALTAGGAASASAANQPTEPYTNDRNQTVEAGATTTGILNTIAVNDPDPVAGSPAYSFTGIVSFRAPAHTKFTSADVTVARHNGRSALADLPVEGCTLSDGDTVITCPSTVFTIPAVANETNRPYISIRPPMVTADADAPEGTYQTTGTLTVPSDPYVRGGTTSSRVTITRAADLPIIDPAVGALAAAALALGGVLVLRSRRAWRI